MKDIPAKNHLPLKIVHGLCHSDKETFEEKFAEITARIAYLADMGFGGIVTNVHWGEDYTENDEDWALFRFALDELDRMGLRAWIYDENGYPSGGAGGLTLRANPEFECRAIAKINADLEVGETVTIDLPYGHLGFLYAASYPCDAKGDPKPFSPYEELICDGSEKSVTFTNKTAQKLKVCAFVDKYLYEGSHALHNTFEARRYIDLMNCDAVREFIGNTYEKFTENARKHYIDGTGLVEAYFTDEPSLMGCYINATLFPPRTRDEYDEKNTPLYPIVNFGRDVENTFESISGLPFRRNLIYLFYGKGETAKKVRYYFHKTTSDLFERSFYAQLSNYCQKNNTRFSGHALLEDDIRHHVIFEGNFFSFLRHMHIPGIDMLHSLPELVRRDMFTPKLISSIAHAYDRPHVMSEVSAHAQGNKVTIDQMYASIALQYAFGVDIFTSYYPETLFERDSYEKYNRAIGLFGDIMAGEHRADVLLYYPIETFMMNHRSPDDKNSFGNFTPEENACKEGLYSIMYELCDAQVDFDFADFDVVKNMTVRDGRLRGKHGAEYKYLVLPPMELTPEMAGIFTHLEAKGVKICIMNDSCFPELGGAHFGKKFSTASALVTSFDRYEENFLIDLDTPHRGVACLCRQVGGKNRYMFVNSKNEAISISCALRDTGSARLFSPLEGADKPCRTCPDKAGTRFEFELGAYEILIVTE